MKILFIYPIMRSFDTFNYGIGSLSAILKQEGHKTNLLKLATYNFNPIIDKIRLNNPDVIAISCTSNHWGIVKKVSEVIKKQLELPIFVGGPHTIMFPDCLYETEFIDGICIGEGEHAFLELINKFEKGEDFKNIKNFWFRDKNRIIKNEIRPLIENLDELPFPDRSIFPREDILRYTNFTFSRGCPYDCTYCCNHTLREKYSGKGKFTRFRSVQNALDEIAHVVENYRAKQLNFDDDSFNKNSTWFEKFCTDYPKKFDIPFYCNTRPELFNEKVAHLLKSAGCRGINIGIESGDEILRKEVLNRKMSDEQIINAFKIAKEYGIKTYSFNMVGIPGETPFKLFKTIQLNQIINPDALQISIFYPYPGSRLGDLCKQNGYINVEKLDYVHNYFHDTVLDLPGFPPNEIIRSARMFHYRVYKKKSLRKALYHLMLSFFNNNTISNSKFSKDAFHRIIYILNFINTKIKFGKICSMILR